MGQLHAHDRAVLHLQALVHVNGLSDTVADAQLDVGGLEGGIGLGEDGVDLVLDLLGGLHQGHHFPDEDVPLPVHQLITRLSQGPGALGGHQVAFGW